MTGTEIELAMWKHQAQTLQRRLDAQLEDRIQLKESLERALDARWDERLRGERVLNRYRRFVLRARVTP